MRLQKVLFPVAVVSGQYSVVSKIKELADPYLPLQVNVWLFAVAS